VCLKFAIRLLEELFRITTARKGGVPAGVNRHLVGESKDFAGLTAVETGEGIPETAGYAVNLCESTLMGQTMSIAIFHRLTASIT